MIFIARMPRRITGRRQPRGQYWTINRKTVKISMKMIDMFLTSFAAGCAACGAAVLGL
jgi:hypothetical protein